VNFGRFVPRPHTGGDGTPQVPPEMAGPGPIGLLVRSRRRRRGFAQIDLAAHLDRSERWVQLLEHGDLPWVRGVERGVQPTPSQLRLLHVLARELGVDLAELVRPPDVVPPEALVRLPIVPELIESIGTSPAAPAEMTVRAPCPDRAPAARSGRPSLRWPLVPTYRLAVAGAAGAAAVGALALLSGSIPMPSTRDHAPFGRTAGIATPQSASGHHTTTPQRREAPPVSAPSLVPPSATSPAPQPLTIFPITAPTAVLAAAPVPRRVVAASVVPAGIAIGPPGIIETLPAGSPFSPLVTFTVENTSARALTVGTVHLTASAFAVIRDDCTRATMAPGATCHVTVQFSPHVRGHQVGALVVPVAGAASRSVPVEGTAT